MLSRRASPRVYKPRTEEPESAMAPSASHTASRSMLRCAGAGGLMESVEDVWGGWVCGELIESSECWDCGERRREQWRKRVQQQPEAGSGERR